MFAATRAAGAVRPWLAGWNWSAAVTACLLLCAVVWTERSYLSNYSSDPDGVMTRLSLSNQNLAAYYSERPHSDRNAWQVATLGWTNAGRFPSSIPSFLSLTTNQLMH